MQSLTDATKRRHPGVVIYGKGDEAHALRTSDHNEDDTAGSRPAQTDADSTPEHRAIDIMLGPAFTRAQAYAYIADLLADPAALARLKYIIFDGHIWSRSNGWQKAEFGGDPHTDHIHISGLAADDENAAGWPAVEGGDMPLTREDLLAIRTIVWETNAGSSQNPVRVLDRVNQIHARLGGDLLPRLDAILAAALDDDDVTVQLGTEALAEFQALRDSLAALPDAVVDEQVARLTDG